MSLILAKFGLTIEDFATGFYNRARGRRKRWVLGKVPSIIFANMHAAMNLLKSMTRLLYDWEDSKRFDLACMHPNHILSKYVKLCHNAFLMSYDNIQSP